MKELQKYSFPLTHMIKIPLEIDIPCKVDVSVFYKGSDVETKFQDLEAKLKEAHERLKPLEGILRGLKYGEHDCYSENLKHKCEFCEENREIDMALSLLPKTQEPKE